MDYFFDGIYRSLSNGDTDVREAIIRAGEELKKETNEREQKKLEGPPKSPEEWKKRELLLIKQYESKIATLTEENIGLKSRMEELNKKWRDEAYTVSEKLKEKDFYIKRLSKEKQELLQKLDKVLPLGSGEELFHMSTSNRVEFPQSPSNDSTTMVEVDIENFKKIIVVGNGP
jgi:predicted RNase H-like nuclease (RuvC/YqgF family)